MPRHHHRHHHPSNSGCTKRRTKANTPASTSGSIVFPYDKVNRKFVLDNYNPDQTQGRASRDEVERFLNEVNQPMAKWFEEWGAKYEAAGCYTYFLYFSILIPPLFFCYALWLANAQNTAEDNLNYVLGQVRTIAYERGPDFAERGLTWKVPGFFPQWMELLTGNGNPNVQISGKGIQTIAVPQQNYGRRQQNNYNGGNMGGGMNMGGGNMNMGGGMSMGGGNYQQHQQQQGYSMVNNQQSDYNGGYNDSQVVPIRSGFG